MAQPIPLEIPKRDPSEELRARLDQAPAGHAEALLSAYAVLQGLHDSGVLDALRGVLGARDHILETVAAEASTPEAIHAMRNLIYWRRVLGSIEPEAFQAIFQAIPEGMRVATERKGKPPGLWSLIRRLGDRDTLRGLAAALDILRTFGRRLG